MHPYRRLRNTLYFWTGFAAVMLLWPLLHSCAHGYTITRELPAEVVPQVNALYQPFRETGFCLGPDGPHNIHVGSWMSSPMPICNPGDIVFHTHPVWAEKGANFVDLHVWGIYRKRYGHTRYGIVLGLDDFKVYEVRQ